MKTIPIDKVIPILDLIVKVIQTDYEHPSICRKAMENLLNKTDELSIEIGHGAIVKRGTQNVIEAIAGSNPLWIIQKP